MSGEMEEIHNHDEVVNQPHPAHPVMGAQQEEMPFAIVQGEAFTNIPKDLYIPPDALEVFLDAFEGPLDLLLYLIRRQNLDILDIPIADITLQYMEYVEMMKGIKLELAADYLVMAAMLAEIKSRMLLPRPESAEGDEEDPRAELIRRLQEYERYKQAAEDLDALPQMNRDNYQASIRFDEKSRNKPLPQPTMRDLMFALKDVMARAQMFSHHHVKMEPLSVRERMSRVLSTLQGERYVEFTRLFQVEEGRRGVVVTLLAILELIKESLIEIIQTETYGIIHVKAHV